MSGYLAVITNYHKQNKKPYQHYRYKERKKVYGKI